MAKNRKAATKAAAKKKSTTRAATHKAEGLHREIELLFRGRSWATVLARLARRAKCQAVHIRTKGDVADVPMADAIMLEYLNDELASLSDHCHSRNLRGVAP